MTHPTSVWKPKGIVFDCDGVLADTEWFQWQGWVEVLKKFHKDTLLTKQAYLQYAGKRADIIASELVHDFSLDGEPAQLVEEKESLLMQWFSEKTLPKMPYAQEAVNFFIKKNLPLACGTGAPRPEALLKLEKIGMTTQFPIVVSGSDVPRGKPHPDIYLESCRQLHLPPEDCLAFEDTSFGVASAKAAGMRCYAIPNEYSRAQDFSLADAVFDSLNEAIRSLENTL